MTESDDAQELRELRAKAYGPGGLLTDAEARRLDELQTRSRVRATPEEPRHPESETEQDPFEGLFESAVEPVADEHDAVEPDASRRSSADEVAAAWSGPGARLDQPMTGSGADPAGPGVHASEDETSDDAESTPTPTIVEQAPTRGILRRRWFPFAAVALALVVGFGIGFAVFGQSVVRSIALSLAVGAEQVRIEAAGAYDPGSLTPVGQAYGVTVWTATDQDGEQECVVLTKGDLETRSCGPRSEVQAEGYWRGASLEIPADGDEPNGSLNVTIVRDVFGEPRVIAQLWSQDQFDWRSQYTEDELVQIDRITELTGTSGDFLSLLGYDGDVPVWQEYSDQGMCLIVTRDPIQRACIDGVSDDATLAFEQPDGTITQYRVTNTTRGTVLTIERGSALADDAAIDDKTGDVEQ